VGESPRARTAIDSVIETAGPFGGRDGAWSSPRTLTTTLSIAAPAAAIMQAMSSRFADTEVAPDVPVGLEPDIRYPNDYQ
jgi:hypothetical protein